MRAFVTGAEGFAGSHLLELLLQEGIEAYGTYLSETAHRAVEHIAKQATFVQCDVRDREKLGRAVSTATPDIVFHLAAVASVPQCERNPTLAVETNIGGTVNVLNCVKDNVPGARVVMISSSEVYGTVTKERLPLTEDVPAAPDNLYGVTKASVELLSRLYAARHGMDIVILRPFNHIGPRQSPAFVSADFASQIARIELGLMPPRIEVGDLTVERDFTDVRDMVKGYVLAARSAQPGETYNLCSGRACTIEEVLNILLTLTEVAIEVHRDPAKQRRLDIPALIGTAEKFARATGWSPLTPLERTLEDTLKYWRATVRSPSGLECTQT